MWGEGLGAALHALFKVFYYYPFHLEYDVLVEGLETEHDCWKDRLERVRVNDLRVAGSIDPPLATEELCEPGCRDDCINLDSTFVDRICAKPMRYKEGDTWADEDGDEPHTCVVVSDCNVFADAYTRAP